jgi:ATP-binding cassette subfamily E protein 1
VYGVVTMPFSVREGINIFLDGFVPTENLRFRQVSLSFKVRFFIIFIIIIILYRLSPGSTRTAPQVSEVAEELITRTARYEYPTMSKQMGDFKMSIEAGAFSNSEIIVMLGENGTGKTTFIRMMAGVLPPDEGIEVCQLLFLLLKKC